MSGGVTLDSGALIALQKGSKRAVALLDRVARNQGAVFVPAGVLAQVWREGGRQAIVARLLSARETTVVPLDEVTARAVGVLCGRCGHSDIVDVSVALCAREHDTPVVTSDPGDIRLIDPSLRLFDI